VSRRLPPSRVAAIYLISALLAAAVVPGSAQAPEAFPFRNPDLPIDARIDDLLARLTLEEKVSLMVERAAAIDRVGIPRFPWWNEALHGVARAGRATVFPQAIGLAATWDTDVMLRVATGIADEARAMNNDWVKRGKRDLYQGLVFWSPNINIFRDPRWGRGQETYGEDPFLTGAIGTAFVKGLQGDDPRYLKVVATPKHYAVHSGPEPLRHTFDASVSEIDLRETYLPAFRDLVVNGKAESVMCSYNAFRALPACGSHELLAKILRKEWGFGGYVVSDCAAVIDIYANHKVRDTPAEAAAMAVLAGTDLECGAGSWAPGHPDTYVNLPDAVTRGLLTQTDIDRALRRLVRAQMRLGVFDPPARLPWAGLSVANTVGSPKHRALALEAAQKSIVLLKNQGDTLPLKPGLGTIAVIGPNADEVDALVGNYNGTPISPVTVLAGIRAAAGAGTKVLYARGGPHAAGLPDLRPVPASALSHVEGGQRKPGLAAAYYNGHFHGPPVVTRVEPLLDFDWADQAPPGVPDDDSFSVRWMGDIQAPATGRYLLGLRCTTLCRLLVDAKPVAQGRFDHEPAPVSGEVWMLAGRTYSIRVEVVHEKYDAIAQLLWEVPGSHEGAVAEAVSAAAAADAVVMVMGLNARLEGEEMPVRVEGFDRGDRTSLDLPRAQQELMEQVVAAAPGKPVVLVLMSGSAVSVNWADATVPAILQAWYGGQAAGTAIADVLFGKVSPGGRLPITVYRSVDQLPPFESYAMKGRTYRYFTGAPLYPFGHGLSYARFTYANLVVPVNAVAGSPLRVSVEVRNAGTMAADEVVQLYVLPRDPASTAAARALRGFQRLTLRPGDTRAVTFTLDERAFSSVRDDGQRVVGPGRFTIAVGGKQPGLRGTADADTTMVLSKDIELTGAVKALAP
jgi:beta-glucosidase